MYSYVCELAQMCLCCRTTVFLFGLLKITEFLVWKMDLKVILSCCVNTNMMGMFWTFR